MKISVYITSYNQKAYLIEAIESVLTQTLRPHQIIVVDDASTDGSQEVIGGYATRYPRLVTPIFHAQNTGVTQARVDALNAVTGDYVTYVDGDDRYLPRKLEQEAQILGQHTWARIAFSNSYYLTAGGKRKGIWVEHQHPPEGNIFIQTFAREFPRHRLFRMEMVHYPSWKQVSFHDLELSILEDWEMRIRLTRNYQAVYCHEPLSEIRLHGGGLSSAPADTYLAAGQYIYQKHSCWLEERSSDQRRVRNALKKWQARHFARQARRVLADASQPVFERRKEAWYYYRQCLALSPAHLDYRVLAGLLFPAFYLKRRSRGSTIT
ncbi:MAG: glycosyltransferase [Chloroflexi bacterium]|nr:glycosyltransferase [Chloroflexota bacterium]